MDINSIVSELKAERKNLRETLAREIKQLDQAIASLQTLNGNHRAAATAATAAPRRTRKLSRAARLAISRAQKARWAKHRAEKAK